jgi:hypothetical protein
VSAQNTSTAMIVSRRSPMDFPEPPTEQDKAVDLTVAEGHRHHADRLSGNPAATISLQLR